MFCKRSVCTTPAPALDAILADDVSCDVCSAGHPELHLNAIARGGLAAEQVRNKNTTAAKTKICIALMPAGVVAFECPPIKK